MVQHVHTHPAVTSTSSTMNIPNNAPSAIKGLEEHPVLIVFSDDSSILAVVTIDVTIVGSM